MRRLALCAVLVAGACTAPAATTTTPPLATSASTAPSPAPTVAPTPTPRARFPHGLYIVRPSLQHPGGTLEVLEADGPLPVAVEFFGTGYDVSDDFVIGAQPSGPPPAPDMLVLFGANGSRREVQVRGLYGIGRPSLSPDAKFVVVQATETPLDPAKPMPLFITDYVIDLSSGSFRRLIAQGTQEVAEGRELPRWLPSGDRILYQTNDFRNGPNAPGCDIIRVVDATSGQTVLTINKDGPNGCFVPMPSAGARFHAEVSLDSSRILIPGQMQIFDAKTGALLADMRAQVLAGLAAAGYKPDTRFPGQGNGGTFPLDGTFSPDNKRIVFDGAVDKDGTFGVVLCQVSIDGSGFAVVRPPVQVTPMFSNNHNYSQVLPHWR